MKRAFEERAAMDMDMRCKIDVDGGLDDRTVDDDDY